MHDGMILAETLAGIEDILGGDLDRICVERAAIGLFFTGVKLDTGAAGACATPLRSIPEAVCCPSSAAAMPFPGKLRGRPARALLKETAAAGGIRRAVGIATMNALAEMCWKRGAPQDVELTAGVDAYDAAGIRPRDHVVVIGAFVPFLKSLKRAAQRFTVLEIDPATLRPDELPHYRPAAQGGEVLPSADVVLTTGTTLVNDTLEHLLASCRPSARVVVVVVGPTVSLLPDPFLRRGVDVLWRHSGDRTRPVSRRAGRRRIRISFLRPLGGESCPAAPRGTGSAIVRYAGRNSFSASVIAGFLRARKLASLAIYV